ncbi:serine hydrolase domain-containing protein [Sphingobacterium hungaricum]|uniref:Serine hydrolase n=1 Tax=Sphingobacterium hungaricum TaxID=2082723 RepID=A0A928US87_9SPHI|nr:serine hydrolase [Sphingobacterium hungaricum]MBE8712240.1 serine hydrolase [Sphingobacterium hungaricum]
MKKFFIWFIGIILLIVALAYIFQVDYIFRAVRVTYLTGHNSAFIDDYTYFENRVVKSDTAQEWPLAKNYNTMSSTKRLDSLHTALQSIAYVLIQRDSVVYEKYYDDYGRESKTNSFSMSKSIVTLALGKAIEQGLISSLDEKVMTFLPELKGDFASELTVGDLASMSSGLKWDESYYSPFSVTTEAYFGKNIRKTMLNLPIASQPGQNFKYQSGDTQLLAMVLEKATKQTLSDYISTNFWKPMGATQDALWQLDAKDGIEKAYCCLASNALDFARFGKLFLHNGKWNDQQLISEDYVQKSTHPRFENSPEYGYGWWLNTYAGKRIFYMRGHLGQYVIVIPELDVIVVRLGQFDGTEVSTDPHNTAFYVLVEEGLKMLGI